ncbi:MAG: peptide ABC transporter substrate-binding protein [Opitutales bacterium]
MLRHIGPHFLGILSSLFLLACSSPEKEETTASSEQRNVFILGNGSEPSSLDFHRVSGNADLRVAMALFEGLVQEHPLEQGVTSPGVAERWEIDESGKRYTFYLRENARWSDEASVTAQQFVDGARRVLDPAFGGPLANLFDFIVGAKAYREGSVEDFNQVGMRAIDALTLEIELENPTPFFLQILKIPVFFPWREEIFANDPRIPQVVNGPFVVEAWVPNEYLIAGRQPHYSGAFVPKVDAVSFLPISNPSAEERGFLTGDLHFTNGVPAATQDRLHGTEDPTYREDAHLATAYILMNTQDPRLSDVRLRQALSLAIDREAIVDYVLKLGRPAASFTPDNLPDYEPGKLLGFDPEKARALLAAWAAEHGELDKLVLSTSMNVNSRRVTEAMQGMWKENLGLEVELMQSEFKVYLNSLNQGDYQLGFLAWYGDYVDPYTFLDVFRSTAPSNRARWNSPSYDALLDKSLVSSGLERKATMEAAEKILMEELPIAPVYWVSQPHRISEKVSGWPPKLLNLRPFTAVDVSN